MHTLGEKGRGRPRVRRRAVKRQLSHLYRIVLCLLLSHFSRVRLCATPQTTAHQAPPSLGFSRQEHWSGLPFPSPMHESEKKVKVKSLSRVRLLVTPWTAAYQAPPSMGFPRQEYWSGMPLWLIVWFLFPHLTCPRTLPNMRVQLSKMDFSPEAYGITYAGVCPSFLSPRSLSEHVKCLRCPMERKYMTS